MASGTTPISNDLTTAVASSDRAAAPSSAARRVLDLAARVVSYQEVQNALRASNFPSAAAVSDTSPLHRARQALPQLHAQFEAKYGRIPGASRIAYLTQSAAAKEGAPAEQWRAASAIVALEQFLAGAERDARAS
jgi:hypothetical protein